MLYVALTFWLLVIVLSAWGVHAQLSAVIRPKILNIVLLPGTLVAQLGHVLGLLITGATVSSTTLYKNDDSWAPETTPSPNPRIPVVGPVIIALLPLIACGVAIWALARYLGGPIVAGLRAKGLTLTLPTSLAGVWQLLRDQINLMESLVASLQAADWADWRTWLFAYLLVCLAVRAAPFAGTLRGALGAIVLLGVTAAAVTSFLAVENPAIHAAWSILTFTQATVLLLLLASLTLRGTVGLVRLFTHGE